MSYTCGTVYIELDISILPYLPSRELSLRMPGDPIPEPGGGRGAAGESAMNAMRPHNGVSNPESGRDPRGEDRGDRPISP